MGFWQSAARTRAFRLRRNSSCHCRFLSITSEQLLLLNSWSKSVTSTPPRILADHITISKVDALYSTLPTRCTSNTNFFTPARKKSLADSPRPALDAHLAPGHSLIFFNPCPPESALAADQTSDAGLGPPEETGFVRRMWASGGFVWTDDELRLGRDAKALARVVRVEQKGFEKGSPMVFVHQEFLYEYANALAATETRVHVYLPRGERTSNTRPIKEVKGLPSNPAFNYTWLPSPTTLFRFSALTFNAHLIHLDRDYSRNVEGYPERLVHGPLTALMLLEAFRYTTECRKRIASFEYRAHNPVVVDEKQHILVDFGSDGKCIVWAQDDNGVVSMTGSITLQD